MDAEDWNRRYATSELIWTAEPNRPLVEVVAGLTSGAGDRTAVDALVRAERLP